MKYGLIAERVGHSFSPEIHKKLFGYDYELKAISKDEIDSFMAKKDFQAINVTIPYKETVIPYLDYIDETAKAIGAVNTIVNNNGKLYGYNTDILGLTAMIKYNGIEIKNKKILVLGSGGTSKTACHTVKKLGCSSVYTVSRTGKDGSLTYDEAIRLHSDADVIINTTPSGMFPDIGKSAVDINSFPNLSAVVDVVYNPLCPKLVIDAKKRGIASCGGLYMLVAQAAFAAEKFVGKAVTPQRIEEIYKEIYSSKENVVFVGMPGSGKSTVGKIIANALNRDFVDTDNLVFEKTGKTPDEIIGASGEKAFRDIESEVVYEASRLQNKVISTGGGAILREINVDLLKENGKIFFLDRPIEDICPTDDRPLSSNLDALKKRYEERYDIYCSCCDHHIKTEKTPNQTAELILEKL